MKRMAYQVHADEERLNLTLREIVGMIVVGAVIVTAMWTFLFLLFAVGQS